MTDRSGVLNKAIISLVYRELRAGRPATKMETVMDLKLSKAAGESVVYDHVVELAATDLLKTHGIGVQRTLDGQIHVSLGARPAISLTDSGYQFVQRFPEYRDASNSEVSNSKDGLLIRPTAFKVPQDTSHSGPSLLVAVMMPFQDEFIGVYKTIKKACTDLGFSVRRADDMWEDQTIIQDIFTLLCQADIVIVDFSKNNPNVMYEAGIAHTLGKTVIPLAQNMSDVPFDMRHHRILEYLPNDEGLEKMFDKLHAKLEQYVPSVC